ncbi:hypothetical protein Tco_1319737 [Tanacetum coccineum]
MPPPLPPQTPTQQAPHTVSIVNSPILKKGDYYNWGHRKIEHYLSHTDYPIWEVIQKEMVLRKKRKAKDHLAMALPETHLAKISQRMTDAKDIWKAIKSRFSGNDEIKEDRRNTFRCQQIEGFSVIQHKKDCTKVLLMRVFSSSGYNSQRENSSSYTDELMYSFFANQYSGPHFDHEDLEQLDEFDLEEMDLKLQVAMISMILKKFYKKIGKSRHFARECKSIGNTRYKSKDNGGRPGKQEEPKALASDTEVTSCSKECVESYAKLKKLYDEQRKQLGDASIEIQAYTQALKKVEAQLVTHQKNQLWYEEKIRFMKINLDDKTDVLTYHKKLLAEAVKEKEELKTKLENFQSSSKGLSKLLNSQMSKRDKSGLGYGDQVHDGVLSYENEVFQSVFDSRSSDVEDSPVHDRFANVEGMHAVPPPMTGNYMPSGPDREIDDSIAETLETVPEPVVVEPKVTSQPKVWSDAPIIESKSSDSEDEIDQPLIE